MISRNRIIIDYHGEEKLVLLAARNRFTGEYLPYYPDLFELAEKYHLMLTPTHSFNSVTELIEKTGTMGLESEGFVVEFSDGQRFKFKGDRYLELHRLISGLSFKHTLEAMASGDVGSIRSQIPDEFLGQFEGWMREIETTRDSVYGQVSNQFALAPKSNRKEFALWVTANHPSISSYLFAMLDGKDIIPMIYRLAFENRRNESAFRQTEAVA